MWLFQLPPVQNITETIANIEKTDNAEKYRFKMTYLPIQSNFSQQILFSFSVNFVCFFNPTKHFERYSNENLSLHNIYSSPILNITPGKFCIIISARLAQK